MNKNIIITEEQFKKLLNEELGISKKVINITNEIEKEFYNFLNNIELNEYSCIIEDDLKVEFKKLFFNNMDDFYLAYNNNTDLYVNGYSYEDNTIYITILVVNNIVLGDNIFNTIQHEVEHYWQCKNKKGPLATPHYIEVNTLCDSNNKIISIIGNILYYSKRIELDAQINGAFNEIKNNYNIKTIKDVYNNSELKYVRNKLLSYRETVLSWDFNSYPIFQAINTINVNNKIRKEGNKPYNKKRLINIIDKALDYFHRKTAKMFTLYIEKNNITNYNKLKNNIKEGRIFINKN